MYFESLPEEIIILLIKKLDESSVINLYYASSYIKNIIKKFGIIKTCRLSRSTIANIKIMQSEFFKDISLYLREVNLCGVTNVSKTLILPVVKRLKNLTSLDVSFTNITLIDFISVHQACPTIKKICIDFKFGYSVKLSKQMLLELQEVFKNMEYIHFFGSYCNLLFSQTVLFILSKVKLKTLQFTMTENQGVIYENEYCTDMPEFDFLQICVTYCRRIYIVYGSMSNFPIFNQLEFNNYEFIFIVKPEDEDYFVYTSPLFINFVNKNFNLQAQCVNEFNILLSGNVGIYIWNKKSTTFDQLFFDNLFTKLKQFFPNGFNGLENRFILHNKWFCVYPKQENTCQQNTDEELETGFWKKRRVAPPAFVLDYDEKFKDENEIELNITFTNAIKSSVTLSTHSKYLNIITYLNLTGAVKYSIEFFNILFRCCKSLVTLTVEAPGTSPCSASISRSIPLSQTIKNISLIDKRIDFVALFSSFSQCKTLENIQLNDTSPEDVTISDPTAMFRKCTNLHCLHIYFGLTLKSHAKHLHMFNEAKRNCNRPYINVKVRKFTELCYSPFTDVFKICAIKPIVL